ncbi:hypothetical protein C7377_1207 [Balneicella halophila]|uniref:Lipoprotein n=1 Tax=Balneicella halophila TaxID=1537566 RepID=A0A7L4UQ01_BALHA|nr:hypothetical protein [Balneicella halophila]PVX50886.1 hypothetical protein C7377_1207 [Balneicella halophila]
MKKLFLVLVAVATLALVACNKEKEGSNLQDEQETQKVIETTTDADVPEFDNENLEEYIEVYDSYLDDYKEAVESKDMSKFQALSSKGQELAEKAEALATEGLSESDSRKLNEYMQEKSKEMQELAQKMMQ